jgi:hypothetical protein
VTWRLFDQNNRSRASSQRFPPPLAGIALAPAPSSFDLFGVSVSDTVADQRPIADCFRARAIGGLRTIVVAERSAACDRRPAL